jgi:hypothetical protein
VRTRSIRSALPLIAGNGTWGVGRTLLTALTVCVVVAVAVALAVLASGGGGVAVAGSQQAATSTSGEAGTEGTATSTTSTQGEDGDGVTLAEGELPDPFVEDEWLDWVPPKDPPEPTPRAKIRGKGKILKYPLLFRYPRGHGNGNEYIVIARTAGRFAFVPEGGWKSFPGWMWVGRSIANLDYYYGLGHGRPQGRCFYWGGAENTKALDKLRVGDKVSITFLLRRTEGVQRRVVRLKETRSFPAKSSQRSLRAIGCPFKIRQPW